MKKWHWYLISGVGFWLFPWPETYHWYHSAMRICGFWIIMNCGAAIERIERNEP